MIKNLILVAFVFIAYAFSLSSTGLAQDGQMIDGLTTPPEQPNFDQGQGGGQALTQENNLTDWWWILPVLAIPVAVFLFTRRGDTADEERNYKYDR